jgi:hypothetical protein
MFDIAGNLYTQSDFNVISYGNLDCNTGDIQGKRASSWMV